MSAPRDTEVEIRLATVADAPAIQAIYGPVVASTHISFELEPPTPDEMAARIAGVLPAHPWIVLTEGEELLGYAYAHHYQPRPAYRRSVETSIYVSPDRKGRGVGGALYRSLLEVLARQGYRQAIAGTALPNPTSMRLHKSLGFQLAGVQRKLGWKLGAGTTLPGGSASWCRAPTLPRRPSAWTASPPGSSPRPSNPGSPDTGFAPNSG